MELAEVTVQHASLLAENQSKHTAAVVSLVLFHAWNEF